MKITAKFLLTEFIPTSTLTFCSLFRLPDPTYLQQMEIVASRIMYHESQLRALPGLHILTTIFCFFILAPSANVSLHCSDIDPPRIPFIIHIKISFMLVDWLIVVFGMVWSMKLSVKFVLSERTNDCPVVGCGGAH